MSKTLQIILGIFLLVAIAGGSFYAGTVVGKNQAAGDTPQFVRGEGFTLPDGVTPPDGGFQGRLGGQGRGAGEAAGGGAFGQIESIDGNTLTVTTAQGNTIQVTVTDTTLIEKNASVGIGELIEGENVIVSGSGNDDGSITARSIQVAPAGRFGSGLPTAPGSN